MLTVAARRRLAALVVIVSASAVAAACGGSNGDHGGGASTGLSAALARIPATAHPPRYVAYSDLGRLRADGIVSDPTGSGQQSALLWAAVVGLGVGDLYRQASSLHGALGLDLADVDSATATGAHVNTTAYDFTGHFDAAAITAKLTRLGAKPHAFGSANGLTAAPHELADQLERQQFYVDETLDQVIVTNSEFASSTSAATLPGRPDAGKSLADDQAYAAIADCLGDVVGALIRIPAARSNSMLVGAGILDPGTPDGPRHEVLCSVPAAGKQAAVHAAFTRAFATNATDPVTGNPLSATVSSAHVSATPTAVRAELVTQGLVGYLILGLYRGEAGYWDGSCPPARVAVGRC